MKSRLKGVKGDTQQMEWDKKCENDMCVCVMMERTPNELQQIHWKLVYFGRNKNTMTLPWISFYLCNGHGHIFSLF